MCFIHSMTSKTNTHGPGENHMSTGFTVEGYPSAGAWVSYALGSESEDLPAFVAIPDPRGVPQAGAEPTGRAAFCRPFFREPPSTPRSRSPTCCPPAGIIAAAANRPAAISQTAQSTSISTRDRQRYGTGRADRQL